MLSPKITQIESTCVCVCLCGLSMYVTSLRHRHRIPLPGERCELISLVRLGRTNLAHRIMLLCCHLRVDGDNLSTSASHHQHPFQTFGENLQEFHVCKRMFFKFVSKCFKGLLSSQLLSRSRRVSRGGPGRLRMTSWASCDLLTITSFSLTAVCIRRTFPSSLFYGIKTRNNVRQTSKINVSIITYGWMLGLRFSSSE